MIPIGIDLGTTYCAVATLGANGKPVTLKNAEESATTPSVIYFPTTGEPVAGEEAKEQQKAGENAIASFFKREMGNPNFALEFYGKGYDVVDLQGILLRKLKRDAEARLGEAVEAAVITVPAYFDNMRREKTEEAAKKAGLRVLGIINEPTAAAFAYGVTAANAGGTKTYMVYDLGGGTFDVTVIRVSGNDITVLGTDGDHNLGGKDWDDRVAHFLAEKFQEEFGDDPLTDAVSFNDLLVACEEGKKNLSQTTATKVPITHGGNRGMYELSRQVFAEKTRDLMERTEWLCQKVLDDIGLGWQKLDGVLLVGGSTRMTMVGEFVERMSGKPPLRGINVDEAVALGAALQAATLIQEEAGKKKGFFGKSLTLEVKDAGRKRELTLLAVPKITDVTAHSLGVVGETPDRSHYVNSIIIKKNTAIPATDKKRLELPVSKKGGGEMFVYVLQGESENPRDCSIVNKYVFTNIAATSSGKALIEVSYAYNRNAVIEVSATQVGTGKTLPMIREPVPADIMEWLARKPEENDPPIVSQHITVLIAIDTSPSMSGPAFKLAQQAARDFVAKMDLSHTSIGLIDAPDGTISSLCLDPTQNENNISEGIDHMDSTDTEHLFPLISKTLGNLEGQKFVIILTDGQWVEQPQQIHEAQCCHAQDIQIASLGFGNVDEPFLKAIANWNMIMTAPEKFSESFSKIATVISDRASVGIQRR